MGISFGLAHPEGEKKCYLRNSLNRLATIGFSSPREKKPPKQSRKPEVMHISYSFSKKDFFAQFSKSARSYVSEVCS